MHQQALAAQEALQDPTPKMPQGEADLRIFARDALAPHHDKDYRSLLRVMDSARTDLQTERASRVHVARTRRGPQGVFMIAGSKSIQ